MLRITSALIAIVVVSIACSVYAEDYRDLVRKGNDAFRSGDFDKALEYYHGAETEIPESPELDYNLAGALYGTGGYEEATERFNRALNTTDVALEANAHYNLGNTYFKSGDYQKAIESYTNALRLAPGDLDAKYNLELARRMPKEQMQQEEQDQDQQQEQEQEQEQQQQPDSSQQQQDSTQQEQEQQGDQQQDQEQQDQQQQPDSSQQQSDSTQQQQAQSEEQKEMSKEDAERILNALKDDEQELQKNIRRQQTGAPYTGKDW